MAPMTKERFFQIAREYGLSDEVIQSQWNTRPADNIDEEKLRKAISKYNEVEQERRVHQATVSILKSHGIL